MSDKNPRNKLVSSSQWQNLRKSLIGKWSGEPEKCCYILNRYLGSLSTTSNDKIKVVMNYLTGTGFRTGRIKHKCISVLRTQMSSEILKRKAQKKW